MLSWLADPASTRLPGREAILLKRGTKVCHGALFGTVGRVMSVGAGRTLVEVRPGAKTSGECIPGGKPVGGLKGTQ